MPTKIKSRKGKTAIKTRRGKPRLKRGVDVEEGASGRKSDMKKPRRDPTEADALHDPPELSRLIAGRLPRLSEELMVVGVGAALYYKLRLIGALGVGSIEAERGDDDQVATDFDAKLVTPTRHA